MSDIEKLETQERHCKVANPAPLCVAFHRHAFDSVLENSSAM